MEMTTLDRLPVGGRGLVVAVETGEALRQRLAELGMVPGTEVTCRMTAPGGDPLAYGFRGTVIALRARDAGKIRCEVEE